MTTAPHPMNTSEQELNLIHSGIVGSSAEFLLAKRLIATLGQKLSYLAVLPSEKEAHAFFTNLCFYTRFLGASLLKKDLPSAEAPIRFFPSHDIPLYESISPDFFNLATRLRTLYDLSRLTTKCVVTSVAGAVSKTLPPDVFYPAILRYRKGDLVERDTLISALCELGYSREALVEDIGFFSIRGNLIDLFPPNYDNPVRIEFFGDEIETIRFFDLESQLSKPALLDTMDIIPAQEIILSDKQIKTFSASIKELMDFHGFPKPERERLVGEIRDRILFPGVEQLLPAFYPRLSGLEEYLRKDGATLISVVIKEGRLISDAEDWLANAGISYQNALDRQKAAFQPEKRFLTRTEFEHLLHQKPRIAFDVLSTDPNAIQNPGTDFARLRAEIQRAFPKTRIFEPLKKEIEEALHEAPFVVLTFRSLAQAERVFEFFLENGVPATLVRESFEKKLLSHQALEGSLKSKATIIIVHGNLEDGLLLPSEGACFISDRNIFGERTHKKAESRFRGKDFVADFKELNQGDFIVHIDHGIGLFEGIKTLKIENQTSEFLDLRYAGGDTLYLPVNKLHKIQRYTAFRDHKPRLDKLGGTAWTAKKARIRGDILKIANDLLTLYAKRKTYSGYAFRPAENELQTFEDAFSFEETTDQATAIHDILDDMAAPKPMDRLVCGDVGYGKTEVAMRAAYNAVLNSKQVALLAPTTILVQQHIQTFRDRFKQFPVTVEGLSRLIPQKKQKEVAAGVESGAVDVVIGTHRLLSREMQFKNLGLVIIDEEHRFGVAHKERLKKLKIQVDVLSLTATPIPRTLQLAISGIRDLSIIATPPENRLAIKTYVSEFDDHTIREAVLREIHRGGQIFFIHNRVQTIHKMEAYLRTLLPDVRIGVSHGQMAERQLERVMLSFVSQEFQILLTTTIVESGLDIPTANTMIINRADAFGLSELYQLRGRVGRSNRQAFCYLLIPQNRVISEDAQKRLKVIQSYTELGAGFKIATHDMEIRGAGNILGTQQSGHIAEIGFDLYSELLEKTIRELKGETAASELDPEINIPISAYLPENYIPDTNLRIGLYKRISQLRDNNEIDLLKEEMRDRFGVLPHQTEALFKTVEIKILAIGLGATAADITKTGITIYLSETTPVKLQRLIPKIQAEPERYQLEQAGKLRIRYEKKADSHDTLVNSAIKTLEGMLAELV